MPDPFDAEAFRASFRKSIAETEQELDGKYSSELKELQSLKEGDIGAITPAITDAATYDALMKVVEEASAKNVAQGELKNRILAMGETAVEIAKKTAGLARILAL